MNKEKPTLKMEKHILESQGSMTRDKQVSLPEVIRL